MEPLEFEAGDFIKIGEPFSFEEQIQRPEYMRFFTLEEQTLDFFQKSLPKEKIIPKSVQKSIKKEIARIEELYSNLVVVTDTDYRVNLDRKLENLDWIKEIYAPYKLKSFDYIQRWVPIVSDEIKRSRNYYSILINALPMPYETVGEDGVPFTKTSEMVKSDGTQPINALDSYSKTRTIIGDDGSETVAIVTMPNTKDDIRRTGFFIGDRKKNMPNPMPEHPFLSSSGSSHIDSTNTIEEIFPSIEAIMSHAVPTTTDPYEEGRSYYKIYDVNASQIPWKSWKQRFPPVDTIRTSKSVETISFPDIDSPAAPSESITSAYGKKWSKNIFPRFWLMNQIDSGTLCSLMLLSKSADSGTVPPDLMHERPLIIHPPSTPQECIKSSNFTEFMESGVFRDNKCVPISGIVQERVDRISRNKKAWNETTTSDILKEHVKLFKSFMIHDEAPEIKYEHIENKDIGQYRKYVLLILEDATRANPDKSRAIRVLVRDMDLSPDNSQYLDSEGKFIVCKHTLELMDEDIESKSSEFFKKWTTVEDGKRVCISCGEQVIEEVLENQNQFDENGRLIVSQEVIDKDFVVEASTDIQSLEELKPLFNFDRAGSNLLYVIISMLQILPSRSQLEKVLNFIKAVEKSAKTDSDLKRNGGLAAIASAVILLQTHNPFLIPRRSFNSKTVKLSGFPRDSDDEKEAFTLDFILNIIKTTFENLPYNIKEPITTIIGSVLTSRKKTREDVIKTLVFAKEKGFKEEFHSAKERYQLEPKDIVIKKQFELPIIINKKTDYSPSEKLGKEMMSSCKNDAVLSVIISRLLPNLRQKETDLIKTEATKSATPIFSKWKEPLKIKITQKEVGALIKKGFPSTKKLTNAKKLLDSNPDQNAVISLLSRTLDVLVPSVSFKKLETYRNFINNLDTLDDSSFVRDCVKGMYFKLLAEISSKDIEILHEAEKKDLTLNMLFLNIDDVTKEVNVLSAREREEFKRRLKVKTDLERELSKNLLAIGVAEYVITNEDRKAIELEYLEEKEPDIRDEDEEEEPESRQFDNTGIDDAENAPEEYDSPNNDYDPPDMEFYPED
jgi:hypothetical protein